MSWLLKMIIILNQIDVKYVNISLIECFNILLTCMNKFCVFGIDYGRNQSFDGALIEKNRVFQVLFERPHSTRMRFT